MSLFQFPGNSGQERKPVLPEVRDAANEQWNFVFSVGQEFLQALDRKYGFTQEDQNVISLEEARARKLRVTNEEPAQVAEVRSIDPDGLKKVAAGAVSQAEYDEAERIATEKVRLDEIRRVVNREAA